MKKSLIALAVLAASGAAMAQSTVTLYGVVDANVNSTKDTKFVNSGTAAVPGVTTSSRVSQTGVGTGGQNGSRWGLRVKEDLGGGLAAVATIEAGVNADNGTSAQGGLAYGRQVFVGLSSGLGTVSLGRQYSAYDDIHGITSAQLNNAYDVSLGGAYNLNAQSVAAYRALGAGGLANLNTVDGAALANALTNGVGAWVSYGNSRVNNSIKLQSASFAGFSGALVYGFGENKTANQSATYDVSANVKYANGPLLLSVAYQENQISKNAGGTFKLQNTLVGGMFDAGFLKVFANYNQAKFTGLDAADEYSVGVHVPIGALTLVGQAAYSKSDDLGENQGYGVEAWYDLSKRTRAYTSLASTKKQKLVNDTRNEVFAVGVRHSF